jgi:deazaflavin-dependent oxidoreductase (nitroreductase family)
VLVWVAGIGTGLIVLVLGLLVVLVVGMRLHWRPVVRTVRRIAVLSNRHQLRSAGSPGAYAAVVGHLGRRTGKPYRTPVRAVLRESCFYVALPYGSHSDWVQNVLANGFASVTFEGHTYSAQEPRVVSLAAVERQFTPRDQRAHRMFGVTEALVMETRDSGSAVESGRRHAAARL